MKLEFKDGDEVSLNSTFKLTADAAGPTDWSTRGHAAGSTVVPTPVGVNRGDGRIRRGHASRCPHTRGGEPPSDGSTKGPAAGSTVGPDSGHVGVNRCPPTGPPRGKMGGASSSVKGGYATAPRQALDTAAVAPP